MATSWPRTARCPHLNGGALIAIFSAGAYGMVMASKYNSRPRAAEILVDGSCARWFVGGKHMKISFGRKSRSGRNYDAFRFWKLGCSIFDQR